MADRYLFIDTETVGFKRTTGSGICELAWIETDGQFNEIARHYSLIDPEEKIGAGAQAVHGISNEMVADQPTLSEYLTLVHNTHPFTHGTIVFTAHNAPFDWDFMSEQFHVPTVLFDTLKLARRVYPDADNHKLGTLAVTLGLNFDHKEAHGALADVETLLAFVKQAAIDTGMALPELVEFSNLFVPVELCKYKKHEGKRWTDVAKQDPEYLTWLLGQSWCKDDLRRTLEELVAA